MGLTAPQTPPPGPRWRPLGAIDRRVLGVLAEKAKTTPDIYPMSLNAICTGCNQKSNRDPLMQLEPDDGRNRWNGCASSAPSAWSKATAGSPSTATTSTSGSASKSSNCR